MHEYLRLQFAMCHVYSNQVRKLTMPFSGSSSRQSVFDKDWLAASGEVEILHYIIIGQRSEQKTNASFLCSTATNLILNLKTCRPTFTESANINLLSFTSKIPDGGFP